MSRRLGPALVVVLALCATIAVSWIPGKGWIVRPDIMGCETGCTVAAGGWPFPYAIDGMSSSPIGSADAVGALFGLDIFRWEMFALDFGIWLFCFALIGAMIFRRR